MRIVSQKALSDFWTEHADAEGPLRAWFEEAKHAEWTTPQHIKKRYRSASFVGDNRIVFNIGGNKYRLVVHVRFDHLICYVKFVGTHADYDRISVLTVEK